MSEESKQCPFVSDDWCTAFDEPCIALEGCTCRERELIKSHYRSLEKRIEELEDENERLKAELDTSHTKEDTALHLCL